MAEVLLQQSPRHSTKSSHRSRRMESASVLTETGRVVGDPSKLSEVDPQLGAGLSVVHADRDALPSAAAEIDGHVTVNVRSATMAREVRDGPHHQVVGIDTIAVRRITEDVGHGMVAAQVRGAPRGAGISARFVARGCGWWRTV